MFSYRKGLILFENRNRWIVNDLRQPQGQEKCFSLEIRSPKVQKKCPTRAGPARFADASRKHRRACRSNPPAPDPSPLPCARPSHPCWDIAPGPATDRRWSESTARRHAHTFRGHVVVLSAVLSCPRLAWAWHRSFPTKN